MEVSLIFSLLLCTLMAMAFYFDLTRYIIPNWLNLAVLALYPVFLPLAPVMPDWPLALAAFAVTFVVGFLFYAFRWMGAGDIKLLAALAPWCGWSMALALLVLYTALLGGILALAVYVARLLIPFVLARLESEAAIPRLLTMGEPIPYGIAISVAFVLLIATGEIQGLGI